MIRCRSASGAQWISAPAPCAEKRPQVGVAQTYGGMTTASGLVLVPRDGSALLALDAETGTPLRHFPITSGGGQPR